MTPPLAKSTRGARPRCRTEAAGMLLAPLSGQSRHHRLSPTCHHAAPPAGSNHPRRRSRSFAAAPRHDNSDLAHGSTHQRPRCGGNCASPSRAACNWKARFPSHCTPHRPSRSSRVGCCSGCSGPRTSRAPTLRRTLSADTRRWRPCSKSGRRTLCPTRHGEGSPVCSTSRGSCEAAQDRLCSRA